MMAITTSNSMRVKARHRKRRADGLRTPAQRIGSSGCWFHMQSYHSVIGEGDR